MPEDPAESADLGQPQIKRSNGSAPRHGVTRRDLLVGAGGLVAGASATMLALNRAKPDPFAATRYDVGAVAEIERRIKADGQVALDAQPRIVIVAWDPSIPFQDATAADVYGPQGEGHPVTSATSGLMALVLRSTHLGCSVQRCPSSGWFEDPCHGSRWNGWGEWQAGPAPRGLDRVRSEVEDGHLLLRLSPLTLIVGPPTDVQVLQQPPAGPHCIDT